MPFAEHRRMLTDAAFATFGEDSIWVGIDVPVRVRIGSEDRDQKFGAAQVVRRETLLMVRSWEVERPVRGMTIMLTSPQHAGTYAISGPSLLDERGVWRCPIERKAA